jgi:hypothetical protein
MNSGFAVSLLTMVTAMGGLVSAQSAGFAGRDVPRLNVDSSCRQSTAQTVAACLNDEQTARNMLIKAWSDFNTQDKTRCAAEAKSDLSLSSYIVLLTCLQISADARKVPANTK